MKIVMALPTELEIVMEQGLTETVQGMVPDTEQELTEMEQDMVPDTEQGVMDMELDMELGMELEVTLLTLMALATMVQDMDLVEDTLVPAVVVEDMVPLTDKHLMNMTNTRTMRLIHKVTPATPEVTKVYVFLPTAAMVQAMVLMARDTETTTKDTVTMARDTVTTAQDTATTIKATGTTTKGTENQITTMDHTTPTVSTVVMEPGMEIMDRDMVKVMVHNIKSLFSGQ